MRSEDPLAFLDEIQIREPNQAFFDALRGYPAYEYTLGYREFREQYKKTKRTSTGGSSV